MYKRVEMFQNDRTGVVGERSDRSTTSRTVENAERVNPLKTKLVYILFKNPVRTSKRTPHFTITKINWLMLFKFNPLKPKRV
jgi:hypothetical protein